MSTSLQLTISPWTEDKEQFVGSDDRTLVIEFDNSEWSGGYFHSAEDVEIKETKQTGTNTSQSTYRLNDGCDTGTIKFYSDDIIDGRSIRFTITVKLRKDNVS